MPKRKKKENGKPGIPEPVREKQSGEEETEIMGQMPDPEAMEDNKANQEETLLSDYDLDEK
jgi:hypothetical protein